MRREDFADEAAWLAWQQTQLDIRRQQQPAPEMRKKRLGRRPKSQTWGARAKRPGVSDRMRRTLQVLDEQERYARKKAEDPEALHEYLRRQGAKWRADNPERKRELSRQSYARRSDVINWDRRRYRIEHHEEIVAKEREYRALNSQKINSRELARIARRMEDPEFAARHREQKARWERDRRARKKAEKDGQQWPPQP